MDPIKNLINFQKELLSNIVPEQFLAPFQKMVDTVQGMDPGTIVENMRQAVEKLVQFSPLPQFQDFFKQLQNSSGDFAKAFQENLLNPMNFFQGFMKK